MGNKSSIEGEQMMPFWSKSMTVPPSRYSLAVQFHVLTQAVSSPTYICSMRTKRFLYFFILDRSKNCTVGQVVEFVLFTASGGSAMPGVE